MKIKEEGKKKKENIISHLSMILYWILTSLEISQAMQGWNVQGSRNKKYGDESVRRLVEVLTANTQTL